MSGLTERAGSSEIRGSRSRSPGTRRSNPTTATAAAATPKAPTATTREAMTRHEPRDGDGGTTELRRADSRDSGEGVAKLRRSMRYPRSGVDARRTTGPSAHPTDYTPKGKSLRENA